MTSIQPELWVDAPSEAVTFYEAAFGANVLHRVGEGDGLVAQLSVGDAAFWVAGTSATMKRFSPLFCIELCSRRVHVQAAARTQTAPG
jgi:uncharacterized glyoxalase superfamily protein PhnB